MLTNTEENYLKTIYKIYENSKSRVSTNSIARQMQTTAASVTDMIKKLAKKDLIEYQKYKGAKLTQLGTQKVTLLIRRHRLWETFLVNTLEFSWEEVHDIAEELEHLKSIKLIDKLDAFLGYPKYDPHGDPIPNAQGKFTMRFQTSLSQLSPGEKGRLIGVKSHQNDFLEYLNTMMISLNCELFVIERNSYDDALKVSVDNNQVHVLTEKVAKFLLVKPIN